MIISLIPHEKIIINNAPAYRPGPSLLSGQPALEGSGVGQRLRAPDKTGNHQASDSVSANPSSTRSAVLAGTAEGKQKGQKDASRTLIFIRRQPHDVNGAVRNETGEPL